MPRVFQIWPKAYVYYFVSIFINTLYDSALESYKKFFLFHLTGSFFSRYIQIFVFPSSPLFLSVSHFFKRWSKINLKVYNVINCLNKNLIRDFVWYQKEERYDIETLSIDRLLNKELFSWNITQNMCTKS